MITLSFTAYQLKSPQPTRTSSVTLNRRRGWWVTLRDTPLQSPPSTLGDDSLIGLGDIGAWLGFGAGEVAVSAEIERLKTEIELKRLSTALEECLVDLEDRWPVQSVSDPLESSAPDRSLTASLPSRREIFSRRLDYFSPLTDVLRAHIITPEIRYGLEEACLDWLSRRLRLPLAWLFSPKCALSAPTHALVSSLDEALSAARRGHRAVKIKVGTAEHWSEDALFVARISAALPDDIELRLDANRAWTREEDALGFCITARAFGVGWVEEPLANPTPARWKSLRDRGGAPIGVDESLTSEDELAVILKAKAATVITLKPMFLGGLIPTARFALLAHDAGARICLTHALESAIGRRGVAHLACALRAQHIPVEGGLSGGYEHDVASPLDLRAGEIVLNPSPGLDISPQEIQSATRAQAQSQARESGRSSLNEHNLPTHPGREAIPHPLESAAIARPKHVAYYYNERPSPDVASHEVKSVSYQDLRDRVALRAFTLREAGIDSRERIGLSGDDCLEWMVTCLALTWIGVSVAPLKSTSTPNEIESAQRALMLSRSISLKLRSTAAVLYLDGASLPIEQEWAPNASSLPATPWAWERSIFLLTTSGTTGAPKPVELKTRALCLSAFGSMSRLGHQLDDRWLACLPLHHVGGLSILTRCLFNQISMWRCPPTPANMILGFEQATIASLTPSLLEQGLDEWARVHGADADLPQSLRLILIGGAPTPVALWERAQKRGAQLRLTWGMTEAASQVCTQVSMAPPRGAIPPLPFVTVRAPREVDGGGCLSLYGPTIDGGALITQDLGVVNEEGWVSVFGRVDDVILSGGVNIHPQEIEDQLRIHPLIDDVAVIPISDDTWGRRPIALLTPTPPKEGSPTPQEVLSAEMLRTWCLERLSPYKCPNQFYWVPEIPRDPLGKVLRKQMPHYDALQEVGPPEPPRSGYTREQPSAPIQRAESEGER